MSWATAMSSCREVSSPSDTVAQALYPVLHPGEAVPLVLVGLAPGQAQLPARAQLVPGSAFQNPRPRKRPVAGQLAGIAQCREEVVAARGVPVFRAQRALPQRAPGVLHGSRHCGRLGAVAALDRVYPLEGGVDPHPRRHLPPVAETDRCLGLTTGEGITRAVLAEELPVAEIGQVEANHRLRQALCPIERVRPGEGGEHLIAAIQPESREHPVLGGERGPSLVGVHHVLFELDRCAAPAVRQRAGDLHSDRVGLVRRGTRGNRRRGVDRRRRLLGPAVADLGTEHPRDRALVGDQRALPPTAVHPVLAQQRLGPDTALLVELHRRRERRTAAAPPRRWLDGLEKVRRAHGAERRWR